MMNRLTAPLVALLLAAVGFAGPAAASGGADIRLEPAPINRLDAASLQRGARTFVNYCLNCHTAKYMRYNRLTEIGIDIAMIQDNLMFATDKVGNTMTVAMTAKDGKAWFGAPPPDLTVEARVRGTEWLYNYFLAFYKDEASVSGWNNLVFPNVAHAARAVEAGRRQPARIDELRQPRGRTGRHHRGQGARACWRRRRNTGTSWRHSPSTSPAR